MRGGVIQVIAGAPKGGAESFFERLAIGLHQSGLPQTAIIRTNRERSQLLRDAGLDVVELSFGGLLDMATGRALRREIEKRRPSIVMPWMNRAARFCPKGKGDFVTIGRLGHYYDLKYYRNCNHLIGITPGICDWIEKGGWPKNKIHSVPNFADESAVTPVKREDIGVPAGVPLIVTMGRLHENKGFDILIRALKLRPEIWLVLAGSGPLEHALKQLAEEENVADRIRFLGWREDVGALLEAADLFVCPSRHEGLGSVILEAWFHNAPIVATRSQGPEWLITDQKDGLLTPIDDVEALAAAIGEIVDHPDKAAKLREEGQKTYQDHYAEARIIAQYKALFEKIAP